MANEKSELDRMIKERLKEKREMDGFVAGAMPVHGLTKMEYRMFVASLYPIIGDDPFWRAFYCLPDEKRQK